MPHPIPPLAVTAYTATAATGAGKDALAAALQQRRSGLRSNDFTRTPLACWIGRVAGLEEQPVPAEHAALDCRNNRLAWAGLNQDGFLDRARALVDRYGATRVAVVLGTSTASIGATEQAYRELDADGAFAPGYRNFLLHSPHSLAAFVQAVLGARGPVFTVATACSSSAKVFAQAERLIRLGWADAAVVGGVDTLCDSVLFGFNALQLVSDAPCQPFDAARRGISFGEAAGFALLEREGGGDAPQLLGWGESSDAHHMSSPHPQGLGARLAISDALRRAGLQSADVDYLNMHGTATPANDAVEAAVVAEVFPASTRASSTKGWTGHTLGAAGIVEAVACLLALEQGFMPGTLNCVTPDAACGPQLLIDNAARAPQVALTSSFGFGGNNAVLAFGRGGRA